MGAIAPACYPPASMIVIMRLLASLLFRSRASIAAENLALRHRLNVLGRSVKRPQLRQTDRMFWVWLSRICRAWRSWLVIVKPETVIKWHRQGFRLYWRWKSRSARPGRPRIDPAIRELIRRMSRENPLWGSPHIRDELALLRVRVAKSTIERYLIKPERPRSQTWKTFIDNHLKDIVAIDFFTVPTVTFRVLYCFVVLRLHRRQVMHFNVTMHPTAPWTAQQLVEAFPYGDEVRGRLRSMHISEELTTHRSPWQNGYVERLIGSIRRECLDHLIVLNESHLFRVLSEYFAYYHDARTHQSLEGSSPEPRDVEWPNQGRVVRSPVLGGLHHTYQRAA